MPIAPKLPRAGLHWLCSTLAGINFCVLVYLLMQMAVGLYAYSADHVYAWKMERLSVCMQECSVRQLDLIDELIDGKCSLPSAVAELRQLHRRDAGEAPDDASLSRRLLRFVAVRLRDHPEERAAVLHRLQEQIER